jgi:hypothetical protein
VVNIIESLIFLFETTYGEGISITEAIIKDGCSWFKKTYRKKMINTKPHAIYE